MMMNENNEVFTMEDEPLATLVQNMRKGSKWLSAFLESYRPPSLLRLRAATFSTRALKDATIISKVFFSIDTISISKTFQSLPQR